MNGTTINLGDYKDCLDYDEEVAEYEEEVKEWETEFAGITRGIARTETQGDLEEVAELEEELKRHKANNPEPMPDYYEWGGGEDYDLWCLLRDGFKGEGVDIEDYIKHGESLMDKRSFVAYIQEEYEELYDLDKTPWALRDNIDWEGVAEVEEHEGNYLTITVGDTEYYARSI